MRNFKGDVANAAFQLKAVNGLNASSIFWGGRNISSTIHLNQNMATAVCDSLVLPKPSLRNNKKTKQNTKSSRGVA